MGSEVFRSWKVENGVRGVQKLEGREWGKRCLEGEGRERGERCLEGGK